MIPDFFFLAGGRSGAPTEPGDVPERGHGSPGRYCPAETCRHHLLLRAVTSFKFCRQKLCKLTVYSKVTTSRKD